MDPERAIVNDVESNVPTPAQGTAPTESRPVSSSHRDPIRLNKPPVYKIRKHGAEECRATVDDDAERAEFWLKNMIRVFNELSCTPDECIKCVVSLLKDTTYQWWNTLIYVVPKERTEFQKKYISQRFLDQKHKEFLELKQGHMTVTEYEREFIQLSKYGREYVSTKEIMCNRFVDGLNEDIKLLVKILELKEFIVLVERACKAEDLSKEKRKVDSEARDSRKRSMNSYPRPNASNEYSSRDRRKQYSDFKTQATSVSSVGNVLDNKIECQQCGRRHYGECWNKNNKACYKCGLLDHFIQDCPELDEKSKVQNVRPSNTSTR
ncbi:Gag-Pol polyprotein [Gossypium australe]|uniref:Gag-Pol polyprotein n=1 Tax=Gossypium australe TaxID=47621 RepID=A0A5B6VWA7_9ROSI|nr:Gag-Pol polyprotein [Gossypium australe]